jgi:hypothetical protein
VCYAESSTAKNTLAHQSLSEGLLVCGTHGIGNVEMGVKVFTDMSIKPLIA